MAVPMGIMSQMVIQFSDPFQGFAGAALQSGRVHTQKPVESGRLIFGGRDPIALERVVAERQPRDCEFAGPSASRGRTRSKDAAVRVRPP